jgi:hypothetical protein
MQLVRAAIASKAADPESVLYNFTITLTLALCMASRVALKAMAGDFCG